MEGRRWKQDERFLEPRGIEPGMLGLVDWRLRPLGHQTIQYNKGPNTLVILLEHRKPINLTFFVS